MKYNSEKDIDIFQYRITLYIQRNTYLRLFVTQPTFDPA